MTSLSSLEMSSVNGGKLNVAGWICAGGTAVSGGTWAGIIGTAFPVAGIIIGIGWTLLSTWVCDEVNDAYEDSHPEEVE